MKIFIKVIIVLVCIVGLLSGFVFYKTNSINEMRNSIESSVKQKEYNDKINKKIESFMKEANIHPVHKEGIKNFIETELQKRTIHENNKLLTAKLALSNIHLTTLQQKELEITLTDIAIILKEKSLIRQENKEKYKEFRNGFLNKEIEELFLEPINIS